MLTAGFHGEIARCRAVGGADEPASRGFEILEHHHEGAVIRVIGGMPHPRRPDRQLVADLRIQACLCDAKSDLPQELPLLAHERLQLYEDGRGYVTG